MWKTLWIVWITDSPIVLSNSAMSEKHIAVTKGTKKRDWHEKLLKTRTTASETPLVHISNVFRLKTLLK